MNVTAEARSPGGNSNEERFLVTAHVEEGLRYQLRDIRFVGDIDYPEKQLRAAVPIRDGKSFNVSLIREGIETLTKLYGSRGYIDFTVFPDAEADDDPGEFPQISLVMYLDQQKQFHIGKVEIVGVEPKPETTLKAIMKPGEIFNNEALKKLLKDTQSFLPPGMSYHDVLETHRDVKAGIVDLTFDFRPCRDSERSKSGP